MRPIRRGQSPQAGEFDPYQSARDHLRGRLGCYCSFCERRVEASLAVEHIEPKGHPDHAHKVGTWTNFLLACANCNATKGKVPVPLDELLLPDRDNTFVAFEYTEDGAVSVRAGLSEQQMVAAQKTLTMAGLDKEGYEFLDDNGKQVVVDRVSGRQEIWSSALVAREELEAEGLTPRRLSFVSRFAQASGGFSIWMKVFEGMPEVLATLIADHPGTAQSGCFDPATGAVVTPHPNAEGLAHGGKL
ncbi:HNH endonuclease [Sinorhizobium meliloti]|uniref:HNH endonuclease n=1 Tax=Rhizobium meliloti TaxID=382 RepID=UPI000FDA5A30|nr:HNH endonuclease [Sinorhizobium meliloti]RVG72596.1 HNH endonuclease [Sinorhizobium meliloti]